MQIASPNFIHFRIRWQILGPDSPGQGLERAMFQRFFDELNSNPEFGEYDDFSYRPDRCQLAKSRGTAQQGGQAFSKVVYSQDALSVVEEFTELSADEFSQKIKVVLSCWFKCFSQTCAIAQTSCLRALVTPVHFQNSRDFLANGVLKIGPALKEKLDDLPHSVGFNFACQRKPGNTPMNLEAKASSWRDGRAVWIEVTGVAPMDQPLNAVKHDQAQVVFGRCKEFLESEVIPLLNVYDREGTD
ncbi:MAG: hypothetical protein JSU63_04940 [Phycisphaerales bacterium]|nr:MAG: hypothetical protein JSU63_04940 [Phycisphaerales bacterium]